VSDRYAPESPGPAIAAAFARIHAERMRGLPFLNGALWVESVGFRIVEDAWVGVVVTPWSMNLLTLPVSGRTGHDHAAGTVVPRHFPSGTYDFVAGDTAGIGVHLACSLFSPVLEFDTQADARAVAERVLEQLLDGGGPLQARSERPPPTGGGQGGQPRADRRAFLGLTPRAGA
jgi:[NiFe] hydrogenase assembly HybE family chaperone